MESAIRARREQQSQASRAATRHVQKDQPIVSLMDLAGQVAIVTGAGSGIGREIARQLVAARCAVALLDKNEETLRQTADELLRGQAAISCHAIDVGDERAVLSTVATVARIHARVS